MAKWVLISLEIMSWFIFNDYFCHLNRRKMIHLVYFSATYTTRKVCRGIARHLDGAVTEHDITNVCPKEKVMLSSDDLLILGMPVYCGRIPEMAVERIQQFQGNQTKAIAVAVYGNREFDDALLEMKDLLAAAHFQPVAAAAFIGRHCIFPTVATARPDDADEKKMAEFAADCQPLLQQNIADLGELQVPGNAEYCPHKRSVFCPSPNDNCCNCGTCAQLCPVGAISLTDAKEVNADLCIACGRCIVVCPVNGREFSGELYAGASVKFTQANSTRKEPKFFFAPSK